MGNTNYISDALAVAQRAVGRPVLDDHAAYIANVALAYIWKKYDWRETIAALPPFYLIPMTQDYGAPFYGVPLDFAGLREAYIVQLNSTPPRRDELRCIRNIRQEHVQGLPESIGYVPDQKCLRLYPRPPANLGSANYLIDGTYKKVSPIITASTLQNSLVPWDDMYLQVFVKALKWAALETSEAPNAQEKKFELDEMLMEMAANEGLELGDPAIAPAEPLVGGVPTGFSPGVITGFF